MSGEYKNVVGYSPSDFFYVSALDSSQGFNCDDPVLKKWIMSADSSSGIGGGNTSQESSGTGNSICPTAAPCPSITSPSTPTPTSTPTSTSTSTIPSMDVPPDAETIQLYKDICINKSLVNSWTDHKINHSGSEQALNDAQSRYHAAVLNTLNLVGGIGFIIWSFSSGWMYR